VTGHSIRSTSRTRMGGKNIAAPRSAAEWATSYFRPCVESRWGERPCGRRRKVWFAHDAVRALNRLTVRAKFECLGLDGDVPSD